MPHVIVKLWPGKSEQQKTRLAEAITKDVMEILHYGEESVSVAMEEVKPEDNVRHCSFLRLLKIVTESLAVLLVGNLLHPFDHLPILLFLNGHVRHGSGLRGAMPVFLAAREPHHVTRSDLLDRSTFALSPAAARRYEESLAERMCVPCSSRSRLESNASPLNKGGIGGLKKRIEANRPREPL